MALLACLTPTTPHRAPQQSSQPHQHNNEPSQAGKFQVFIRHRVKMTVNRQFYSNFFNEEMTSSICNCFALVSLLMKDGAYIALLSELITKGSQQKGEEQQTFCQQEISEKGSFLENGWIGKQGVGHTNSVFVRKLNSGQSESWRNSGYL